jgi:ATP-binding cassette subfamily B protein
MGITSVIPWIIRVAIDDIRADAPSSAIWKLAGDLVAVAIFSGFFRFAMREIINSTSRRIEFDLRNDLFRHLTSLDASWYGRNRTGDIMARLTNDLNAVRMAAGPAVMYATNTLFGAVFALAFMLHIDRVLTLLALLPMIALPMITVYLGGAIHKRFQAVQENFASLTTHAQENLTGTRIVRAYRQESAEISRFAVLNDEYMSRNMSLAKLYGTMHPLFGLLAGMAAVVVLGLGGRLVLRGTISVGAFVAFGIYLNLLTWPLIALGWVINLFQRGSASMARLSEILDAKSSLDEPAEPVHLAPVAGGRSIEFRNVGFTSRRVTIASRAGFFATSASLSQPERRSASSALPEAARHR